MTVALVTGASGGIGRAIALRLAQSGHAMALHYHRHREAAEATALAITQQGGTALAVQADLCQRDAARTLVEAVASQLGGLDVLVLNHGVGWSAPVLAQAFEEMEGLIATNLTSAMQLTALALPQMLRRRFGRVVAVSSIVASRGGAQGAAAYAASKAGLLAYVQTLAKELSPRFNFTANAVSPGVVPTAMTENAIDQHGDLLRRSIPLGRFASADDIANAVAFLVSAEGSYVNGHNLAVDGGQSLGYWNHRKSPTAAGEKP
jgi:3-oxoacyl-[acyl-carrier protein] reductase